MASREPSIGRGSRHASRTSESLERVTPLATPNRLFSSPSSRLLSQFPRKVDPFRQAGSALIDLSLLQSFSNFNSRTLIGHEFPIQSLSDFMLLKFF